MSVFHKENTVLLKNKFQAILPTTMLEHFLIINNFVSGVYMYDISDIKYHLQHIHLDKCLFKKIMIKIAYIYVSITVSLLQLIYISWVRGNSQHLMLANPE